jgi:hypothetical protein
MRASWKPCRRGCRPCSSKPRNATSACSRRWWEKLEHGGKPLREVLTETMTDAASVIMLELSR